jgi:hypothetical protein
LKFSLYFIILPYQFLILMVNAGFWHRFNNRSSFPPIQKKTCKYSHLTRWYITSA